MSDRGPALPPAAVDITANRAAIDAASVPVRMPRLVFIGPAVLAVLAAVAVIALLSADGSPSRPLIALVLIVALLAIAALVLVPLRSAARLRRGALTTASLTLERTVDQVVAHLASIGYVVPAETVLDWLSSPESKATVPLVHDSVIAARWWRPAEGDDRVFVEPFLRQDGRESALPALPPL